MRELVVLSGKGGTGKTSLSAALAFFGKNMVLCDADVDAADLHLLMAPDVQQSVDFKGGGVAVIDPDRCSECGRCRELCRFDAISELFEVDEIQCEGCGVCVDLCPEEAIDFPTKTCGQWFISDTRFGPMVHARLGLAEENSGRLVTLVRQEAKKLAEENGRDLIITDGPPGVGCPVIASIGGASALLVITEPTVSGIHDMKRVMELADHFKVPTMVCINKCDLNQEQTAAIEAFAESRGTPVVGKVPFNPVFTESMIHGKTVLEYDENSDASQTAARLWETVISSPMMRS
ncbi:MAG: (4Fe-4S)-binding protein [Desulfobacterales bacterium]|nr:(4Fe-4S)-binding protein [Desulfobacterales bacterium]